MNINHINIIKYRHKSENNISRFFASKDKKDFILKFKKRLMFMYWKYSATETTNNSQESETG